MKITLDLSDLVARGRLSAEEAERLRSLAAEDAGALGTNILFGFGTVAVALGAGALLPNPITAMVLGIGLLGLGFRLRLAGMVGWDIYAQICLTLGALAFAGGAVLQSEGAPWAEVLLTAGLAAAAVAARSGLLAALAVLMLDAALGSGTAYMHATYAFWTPHPALSIGVLSALAFGLYQLSLRLGAPYERLALVGARTAILLVNLAFLIGSLFGDSDVRLPDLAFVVGWAVVLVATGGWAVRANRRWVVNAAAVFGAIHFYTQWFGRLGASAVSIVLAGLLLIGFGLALGAFNRAGGRNPPAGPPPVQPRGPA